MSDEHDDDTIHICSTCHGTGGEVIVCFDCNGTGIDKEKTNGK